MRLQPILRAAICRRAGPCARPQRWFALFAALLLAFGGAAHALDVPYLSGRVVDNADLLPPAAEQAIATRLEALERETGGQVVVLTVPTLGGQPVEDYALKVAETWKLGRKGIDDGVLFLIARDEHALRLEVGYGLEGKLPDVTAKRIIDELVVPRFRQGDFAGGVEAAVDAIDKAARGGEALPPPQRAFGGGEGLAPSVGLGRLILGALFFLFITPFAAAALSASGSSAWFLYVFLTLFLTAFPFAIFGPAGLVAPILWLVGFPLARLWWRRRPRRERPPSPAAERARQRRSGSWWGGPGYGGGWGGGLGGGGFGGGGGGGFSGGGGSFGGGGASGRW